jgi:hypothetical protein
VRGRIAAPIVGLLLVLAAGWWLMRESGRGAEPPGVTLRRPEAAAPEAPPVIAVPGAELDATPRPLLAGAERAAPGDPGTAGEGAASPARSVIVELLITHANGAPATGATVALGRGGMLLGAGLTDHAGRVSLALSAGDDGGAADVAIGGVGLVPVRRRLEHPAGRPSIVLPEGHVIEGRVLVDGGAPPVPLVLLLTHGFEAERDQASELDVPRDALWKALVVRSPALGSRPVRNGQLVGTDGRFRFSGLPGRQWLALGTDDMRWVCEPETAEACAARIARGMERGLGAAPGEADAHFESYRHVDAPASDLVLALRSVPMVSGRVVAHGGTPAVPSASVRSELRWEGGSSTGGTILCDGEGRFALPMRALFAPVAGLTLRIEHPEGRGYRMLELGAADCDHDHDLGDIELDASRPIELEVRDAHGVPVERAVAVTDDEREARSPLTGADGRCAFHVPAEGTPSLTVWAPRHTLRTVGLPPPGETRLAVMLERSPSLDVTVLREDGSAPEGLRLTLRASQALFASAGRGGHHAQGFVPDPMVFEGGMTRAGGSRMLPSPEGRPPSEASGSISFLVLDEAQAIRITDLLPAVPFELLVHDEWGGIVHGPDTLSLGPAEWRELSLHVTSVSRDLEIQAVDPGGRPVHAAASIQVLGGNIHIRRTDAEGRVAFRGLQGRGIRLLLRGTGLADVELDDVQPPSDGAPLRVVMHPGRDVSVTLRDEFGRAVPAESVQALAGARERRVGRWLSGMRTSPAALPDPQTDLDRFIPPESDDPEGRSHGVLIELPADDLVIEARVGGRRLREPCAAGTSAVEFVVSGTGSLVVRWKDAPGASGPFNLVLRREDGDPGFTFSHPLVHGEHEAREVTVPALAPGRYVAQLTATEEDGAQIVVAGPADAEVRAGAVTTLPLTTR